MIARSWGTLNPFVKLLLHLNLGLEVDVKLCGAPPVGVKVPRTTVVALCSMGAPHDPALAVVGGLMQTR